VSQTPSPPRNPVYVKSVDPSVLAFSLSFHRHPYSKGEGERPQEFFEILRTGVLLPLPVQKLISKHMFSNLPACGICEHNHRRSECKDGGGAGMCDHNCQRSKCKLYGGSSICEHNRRKSRCKECPVKLNLHATPGYGMLGF
jgi:hypothetical protein